MATGNITKFKKTLTDNNYHVTKAREATFKLLIHSEPQTMAEILARAVGVDRVSIYRNVELFEKLGIVRRVYVGWKYKLELSDKFIAHHHHLSCLKCGLVIDIKDEKHIYTFIRAVCAKFDFEPIRHQFEIEGLCAECRAKQ
jgi:Fe2+ or Zn2+ uptake regulation protein